MHVYMYVCMYVYREKTNLVYVYISFEGDG